jgi:hypothetical protein
LHVLRAVLEFAKSIALDLGGASMPDRFIPEKIRDFLNERPGRPYCDTCIQERLGLRWRQQVQLVTATLAVTRFFTRERSECCTCHEEKRVISSVQPNVENAPAPSEPSNDTRRAAAARQSATKLVLVAQRMR